MKRLEDEKKRLEEENKESKDKEDEARREAKKEAFLREMERIQS